MCIRDRDDPTEKTQNREPTDLDIAKQHIAEYLNREFGEPSEFSDMAKISLAYTTDEEHNLPILVYADLEQYRLVFEYIETFYNTVRIHSHCDYMSPNDFEKLFERVSSLPAA